MEVVVAFDKNFGSGTYTREVLKLICRIADLRCRSVTITEDHDSFEGTVQAVWDLNATIGVGNPTLLPSRWNMVHFVSSYFGERYVIAIHHEDNMVRVVNSWPEITQLQVGIAMLSVLLSQIFFIALYHLVIRQPVTVTVLWTAAFKFFGSALYMDQLPSEFGKHKLRPSILIMFTTWLLWSTIIVGMINSSISAIMVAKPQMTLPFNDPESFFTSSYALMGSPFHQKLLDASGDRHIRQMAQQIQVIPLFELQADKFFATRGTKTAAVVVLTHEGHCPFERPGCTRTVIAMKNVFKTVSARFFIALGSPVRRKFERAYNRLYQHGILQYHHLIQSREDYKVSPLQRCNPVFLLRKDSHPQSHAISLANLAYCYWFLLEGTGVSLVAWILEIAYANITLRRRK